ncbi:MAG: FAD:protein FMN transferase [Solirubrobacteraceae bacterium]
MTTPTATAHASWQALGTGVELVLSNSSFLAQARAIVERQLDEIDIACSRFRDDSELTRVNIHSGHAVTVDPLLTQAVEVALRAAELTNGDVDPTVGAALEPTGYNPDGQLLVRAGWKTIKLNLKRSTLRIPVGVKLDLGATAKAWAADRASRAVHGATGCGVLVSLGGDISTAGPSPAAGWRVHVTDDHRSEPNAPGQTISISSGGLATSSTTVRRWRHEGHTMHHIIDPSTGNPATGLWRTASVAAADCTDANIAATAAIVRGPLASEWLAELGLPARLVAHDGSVLTVGSWPEEEEEEGAQ